MLHRARESTLKRAYPVLHQQSRRGLFQKKKKPVKALNRFPKDFDPENVNPETGEYTTRYGDWLHRAEDPIYLRDKRIYDKEMEALRKKYKMEQIREFQRKLEDFTRREDSNFYRKMLRVAQKRERQRLKNIRWGALRAAQRATRARRRMDTQRRQDLREYQKMDIRRDVIREMMWENPEKTWITAENLEERLNLDFMDSRVEMDGLPNPGEYDTAEGLFNSSDKFFNGRELSAEECISSITDRPIPSHHRTGDTLEDWHREYMPWQIEGAWDPGDNIKKDDELMPMWWYVVDWDKAMLERNPNVNTPAIFEKGVGKLFAMELDPWEDLRLMSQKGFWDSLMGRNDGMDMGKELIARLVNVYSKVLPKDVDVKDTLHKAVQQNTARMEREYGEKIWKIYEDFFHRVQHSRDMVWESGKMNYDSGRRRLKKDTPKWKYMAFKSDEEYEDLKARMQTVEIAQDSLEQTLHDETKTKLEQFEAVCLGRRIGVEDLKEFIEGITDDELKLMYLWIEELNADQHDGIVVGNGWGFTQYDAEPDYQAEFLKMKAPRSVDAYMNPEMESPTAGAGF